MFNFLCRHDKVKIVRWHPNVTIPEQKGKVLYTDRFGVLNFAQCDKCGKFLDVNQREKLYEQKIEDG